MQIATYGLYHQTVATSHTNIGLAYKSLNQFHEAIDHMEKSLEFTQKVYGPTHPESATCMFNIGVTYKVWDGGVGYTSC